MRNFTLSLLALALISSAQASSFRYSYTLSTTVPDNYASVDALYGDWTAVGEAYGCSNWAPSPSTVGKGIAYEQTATDCKQDQERTVQARKKNERSGVIENNGSPTVAKRTITQSSNRESIGILENWLSYDPTYTSWTNTNALYGCTDWTPDPSLYTTNSNFSQSSSTCKTDQERQRQDREQEKYSLDVRNAGTPVTESQTLTGQSATRPYSIKFGAWTDSGDVTSCSNWSPDPSTVASGTTFTQTATDCTQKQSRSRLETYVDQNSGSTVTALNSTESKNTTVSSTRSNTGTMVAWAETTASYTDWKNTTEPTCSSWSPSPYSYSESAQFSQTGSDCSVMQTRSKQNRELNSATGEMRNSGDPTTESRNMSGVESSRQYQITYGDWEEYSDGVDHSDEDDYENDATACSTSGETTTCTTTLYRTTNASYLQNGTWTADPEFDNKVQSDSYVSSISNCPSDTANNYAVWKSTSSGISNSYYWGGSLIYSGSSFGPSDSSGGYYSINKRLSSTSNSTGTTATYSLCRNTYPER